MIFEEFSRKFFILAERELKKAERAYKDGDFPECVFHSQQCVEMCVKSLIELKREYVFNHGIHLLSSFLRNYDKDEIDIEKISEAMTFLSDFYTKARYPFLHMGKVYMPDDIIDENIAKKSLNYARDVLEITRNYLKRCGII